MIALDFGGEDKECAVCDSGCDPGCWKLKADGVVAGDGGFRVERMLELRILEKGDDRGGAVEDDMLVVESGVKPRR